MCAICALINVDENKARVQSVNALNATADQDVSVRTECLEFYLLI